MTIKTIAVLNNNANNFDHYYKPFLSKLLNYEIKIIYIQLDYGLSSNIKKEIQNFINLHQNIEIHYLPVLERKISITYHLKIKNFLNYLNTLDIKSLFLNTEYHVLDRYMISFSNKKNIKVFILSNSMLSPWVLDNFFKNQKEISLFRLIFKFIRSFSRIKTYAFFIINFLNYYFMPFLINQRIYVKSNFDKKALFTSCRSDLIILHDKVETEALKKIFFKSKEKIYYFDHPLINFFKDKNKASKNLLLLLGGYDRECTEEQILLYYNSVIKLKNKFKLKTIHIRLHPRTKENITWYKKLINDLKKIDIEIELHSLTKQDPLLTISKNYEYILGPMTSGLKTLSYNLDLNIFCILNVYDPWTKDEKYHFGDSNNIFFINNPNDIDKFDKNNFKKSFKVKSNLEDFIFNYLK